MLFQRGAITGADPLGVLFDGRYELLDNGQIAATIEVSVPPNSQLVQGVTTGSSGLTYKVETLLEQDFVNSTFVAVQTPLGPVNARFRLIRGIDKS